MCVPVSICWPADDTRLRLTLYGPLMLATRMSVPANRRRTLPAPAGREVVFVAWAMNVVPVESRRTPSTVYVPARPTFTFASTAR